MKVVKSITAAIRFLWSEGFFKSRRAFADVKEELSKHGYNFPDDHLGMALYRAEYLTRLGKRGNYRYIQKCPYTKNGDKHE
jgi:hypothetical protein